MRYASPFTTDEYERYFKTKCQAIFKASEIDQILLVEIEKVGEEIEDYEGKGSGFTLVLINSLILNVSQYKPIEVSLIYSYSELVG